MTIFDMPWYWQATGYAVWINYFYWFYIHPRVFGKSEVDSKIE
jgi:hypothetical protein